jgi:hypothetical protein
VTFRDDAAKLDLILDVLRVHQMHESACATFKGGPECDCWLVEPADAPPLAEEDLEFQTFGFGYHNGPMRVQVTYVPTGHSSTREGRSMIAAKAAAMEALYALVPLSMRVKR